MTYDHNDMGSFDRMPTKETAWHRFATKLSCHGLPDLGNAERKTERTVWAILVTLFLVLLTYGIAETTLEYIQSPVMTSIAQVGTTVIPFPKVYICPPQLVNYEYLDPYTLEKIYNLTHYKQEVQQNSLGNATDMSSGAIPETHNNSRMYGPGPMAPTTAFPPPPSTGQTLLQRKLSVWQKADGSFYAAAGMPADSRPAPRFNFTIYINSTNSTDYLQPPPPPPPDIFSTPPPPVDIMELLRAEYANETTQELFLRSGVPLEHFLEECAFQSAIFPCKNRTRKIFDTGMGTCFLVDVEEAQAKRGIGLDIILFVETPYYPDQLQNLLPITAGPSLWLGDEFDPFAKSRILLPTGNQVRVGLAKTRTRLLNAPKSSTPQRCVERHHRLHTFNLTYSVDACQADCLQEEITKNCHCMRPVDSQFVNEKFSSLPICTAEDIALCVSPMVDAFAESASQARHRLAEDAQIDDLDALVPEDQRPYYKCIARCERPCSYTSFATTVTQTPLLWESNRIMLEIAFESLDVVYVQQHPAVTTAGYVSNMGGQLGIWLGASLLTVCQVIIFLISYCVEAHKEALVRAKQKRTLSTEEQHRHEYPFPRNRSSIDHPLHLYH